MWDNVSFRYRENVIKMLILHAYYIAFPIIFLKYFFPFFPFFFSREYLLRSVFIMDKSRLFFFPRSVCHWMEPMRNILLVFCKRFNGCLTYTFGRHKYTNHFNMLETHKIAWCLSFHCTFCAFHLSCAHFACAFFFYTHLLRSFDRFDGYITLRWINTSHICMVDRDMLFV